MLLQMQACSRTLCNLFVSSDEQHHRIECHLRVTRFVSLNVGYREMNSQRKPARQTLHMQFNITCTHQNWMPGGAGSDSWLCDLLSGFQNVPTSSSEGVYYSCPQEMNQRDD
jgi:hypothetical protein